MRIRKYQPSDCRDTAQLFYDTVHSVNAKDYTQEQLIAWAPNTVDLDAWNASLQAHYAVVAVEKGILVGFGDMDSSGYLDRLYVHKDYQHQGIATAICQALEKAIPADSYITHASITAKPFFEQQGYRAVKQQTVERRGVLLTNYIMQKTP